jgi:hypothetical protein
VGRIEPSNRTIPLTEILAREHHRRALTLLPPALDVIRTPFTPLTASFARQVRSVGRQLIAAGVGAVLAVWVAFAYASPPDPNWIPGVYDDRDCDDVVGMVMDATGVDDAQVPQLVRSLFAGAVAPVEIGPMSNATAQLEAIRGPPTRTRDASAFPLTSAPRRSSSVALHPDRSIDNSSPHGAAPEVQAGRSPAMVAAGVTAERRKPQ